MNQPAVNTQMLRGCRVYVFIVWDPHNGYSTKTCGYVGETGREPFERLLEHVYDQPWADTIVGWFVLDTIYPNKAAVLAAEAVEIKTRQPLYNHEENLDNPRRIPIPEARRQRAARDAAKGVATPWVASKDARPTREPAVRKPAAARRRTRRYPRPIRRLRVAAATWAPSTLLAWVGAWRVGLGPWLGLRVAAALVATLVLGVWWLLPRRRWDGMVAGVVAVGAALVLLGTVASALPHQGAGRHPVPAATRHR